MITRSHSRILLGGALLGALTLLTGCSGPSDYSSGEKTTPAKSAPAGEKAQPGPALEKEAPAPGPMSGH